MSIFSTILAKIFPSSHPAVAIPTSTATPAATAAPAAGTTPMPAVNVEQILNDRAQAKSEKLNWRTSIVDLMKLLDLDSSLTARKQLATELKYSGDMDDSATMNMWLQKQVMKKLADNGGQVPADLKD